MPGPQGDPPGGLPVARLWTRRPSSGRSTSGASAPVRRARGSRGFLIDVIQFPSPNRLLEGLGWVLQGIGRGGGKLSACHKFPTGRRFQTRAQHPVLFSAAGLDVCQGEPAFPVGQWDPPLARHPNVYLTHGHPPPGGRRTPYGDGLEPYAWGAAVLL